MQNDNSALIDENSLQPFFVLHKASQSTRRNSAKSKRKIDTLPKDDPESIDSLELRLQNFRLYWSEVESIVKDVLRNLNAHVFEKIDSWIRQSFDVISSSMVSNPKHATSSYPLLFPANYCTTSRQIFTGLVCTKNLESVDDVLTFAELARSLKSRGYHVANLTSLEFSQKNGISGCLLSLLQQFITTGIDAADVSALASWYCEQGSNKKPIIVILDGLERCCGSVLSDFIIMLSEWAIKIPIILMLGVTTTVDALQDILPSCILQHLALSKFVLEPPSKRMDSVIASVLVQYGACFCLGEEVLQYLRNYFLRQDGTLTSFMRALKMASFQHFTVDSSRPGNSTFIGKKHSQDLSSGNIALLQARNIEQVFGLPSHPRNNQVEPDADASRGLVEMQKQYTSWRSLVKALMGDPRRRIQLDLMESQKFLTCSCCGKGGGESLPSLHDTAIMYSLAQEHGDLINLHNWFQSFKETICHSGMRTKNRLKPSPSHKKRKTSSEPQSISNASIQARFCRAISELQITGLLRMPSKRRPDFVQRVAFGV